MKRISVTCATLLALVLWLISAPAVFAQDATWGGGVLNWTDTSALGWNGPQPTGTANIGSGSVTVDSVVTPITVLNMYGLVGDPGDLIVTTGGDLDIGDWAAVGNGMD